MHRLHIRQLKLYEITFMNLCFFCNNFDRINMRKNNNENETRYLHKINYSTVTSLIQKNNFDKITNVIQNVNKKRYDCNNLENFDVVDNFYYIKYINYKCKDVRLRVNKFLMRLFLNSQKNFTLAMNSPMNNGMIDFCWKWSILRCSRAVDSENATR